MRVIKYFYLSAGLRIWKHFFLRKASLPAIMWRQMGHLHLQFSLKIVDDRQKLTFCAQQYILCNVL